MNRRWIHNDTPCRVREDADAGYECEVVDATDYDALAADIGWQDIYSEHEAEAKEVSEALESDHKCPTCGGTRHAGIGAGYQTCHSTGYVFSARELLEIIVANAVMGPDPKMCGATDCYHVPLDDIDAAREWLEANAPLEARAGTTNNGGPRE